MEQALCGGGVNVFNFFRLRAWTVVFQEYDSQRTLQDEYDAIVYARTHWGALRKARDHLDFLNDPFAEATPQARMVYANVRLFKPVFLGVR